MELRISKSKIGSFSIVKVDGALTREGLCELEKVASPCRGALRLDLTELRTLDTDAVAAIQALGGGGAEIFGASPYIALLLGPVSNSQGKARERSPVRGTRHSGKPIND
jgi:hypothetical protein